jgi:ribosomal protein L37AE/L43A
MRGIPYHCPYCADENLRPHGEKHGEWECRSCLRAFRLGFIAQLSPTDLTTHAPPTTDTSTTEAPTGRRHAS